MIKARHILYRNVAQIKSVWADALPEQTLFNDEHHRERLLHLVAFNIAFVDGRIGIDPSTCFPGRQQLFCRARRALEAAFDDYAGGRVPEGDFLPSELQLLRAVTARDRQPRLGSMGHLRDGQDETGHPDLPGDAGRLASWSPRSPPAALNLPDYQLGNLYRSRFPAAKSVQPLLYDRRLFPRAEITIVLAPR